MKTKPNEPLNCNNGNGFWNDEYNLTHSGVGLTKREYFAALALQGLTANLGRTTGLALAAVQYADSLIAELNRGKDGA